MTKGSIVAAIATSDDRCGTPCWLFNSLRIKLSAASLSRLALDFDDLAFITGSTPQINRPTTDRDEHFVEMPSSGWRHASGRKPSDRSDRNGPPIGGWSAIGTGRRFALARRQDQRFISGKGAAQTVDLPWSQTLHPQGGPFYAAPAAGARVTITVPASVSVPVRSSGNRYRATGPVSHNHVTQIRERRNVPLPCFETLAGWISRGRSPLRGSPLTRATAVSTQKRGSGP